MVLAAVHQYGDALQWASKDLRADREVVLAAVRHADDLSTTTRTRKISTSAEEAGGVLQWASPGLRADREVLLAQDAALSRRADPATDHF